ncbi:glutathione S-transferase family protein [Primorskyibacter sp. S187A]|uniref:glutathione S-transferase family protein n=1 Tax=Primorskyibacter sp. S187A TaxID=3415130 RepID=UPI003C7A8BDB
MLKLYYSKGSSAIAAHVLLAEVGAAHTLVEISIPKGAHTSDAFLAINPKGRVPVLETPQGVLTENPAILEYIADTYPEAGLAPEGAFAKAKARALSAYLCATAHVAFAHKQRGLRWAREESSLKDMQSKVAENIRDCAVFLENDLDLAPWAMGESYSYCDPYLMLMARWLKANDIALDPFPKLARHFDAIKARPATQEVFALHGLS